MGEYNGKAFVKAVGKYKEKFNSTGFLLEVDGNEFWADFPGQLSYRDWKEKTIEVNITQNAKGYWSGTIAGQGGGSSGPGSSAGPGSSYTPDSQERPPQRDVQDDIRFAQALNLACQDVCHQRISEPATHERVRTYYQILKTRQFPADMSSTSDVLNKPVEVDSEPFSGGSDDIPF